MTALAAVMGAGGSKGPYPAIVHSKEFEYHIPVPSKPTPTRTLAPLRETETERHLITSTGSSSGYSTVSSASSNDGLSLGIGDGSVSATPTTPLSSISLPFQNGHSPVLSEKSSSHGESPSGNSLKMETNNNAKNRESSGSDESGTSTLEAPEVRMRLPRPNGSSSSKRPAPGGPLVCSPKSSDTHLEHKVKQCDVMISYSHRDKEVMKRMKDALEKNNISVWVDVTMGAGVNFLEKIGEAIIDSKIFISVLTEHTVQSKFCQDELALAYISNKPIIPVCLKRKEEVFKKIPTGMRLQLASFDWTYMTMDTFTQDFRDLFKRINGHLAEIHKEELHDVSPLPTTPQDSHFVRKPLFKKRSTKQKLNVRRSLSRCSSIIESCKEEPAPCQEFWEKTYGEAEVIEWSLFETSFLADYAKQLGLAYNECDKEWFTMILKRELEVGDDLQLYRGKYKEFISDDYGETLSIYDCVNDLAVENYTMKEVFNIESSVRLDAINCLGKFCRPAVVEALLDLLEDPEHDVRASACISLVKTKGGDEDMKIERLMRRLNDADRFVRESACVAIGYLRAPKAVHPLLKIWRNDPMSEVRKAAQAALDAIGGPEVRQAMDTTKALSDEIGRLTRFLTKSGSSRPSRSHGNSPNGLFRTVAADTQMVRDAFLLQDSPGKTASLPRQHKLSMKAPPRQISDPVSLPRQDTAPEPQTTSQQSTEA